MTNYLLLTPRSVSTARAVAITQAVMAAALGILGVAFTVAMFAGDRAAAQAGNPNEFTGLGEFLGAAYTAVCFGVAVLIGVPAVRLRRARPGARLALIVGELIVAVPTAGLLPFALSADGQLLAKACVPVWVGLAATVLGAATRRTAREWSAAESPVAPTLARC